MRADTLSPVEALQSYHSTDPDYFLERDEVLRHRAHYEKHLADFGYTSSSANDYVGIPDSDVRRVLHSLGLRIVDPSTFRSEDYEVMRHPERPSEKGDGVTRLNTPLSIGRGIVWEDCAVIVNSPWPDQRPLLGMSIYSKGHGISGWVARLFDECMTRSRNGREEWRRRSSDDGTNHHLDGTLTFQPFFDDLMGEECAQEMDIPVPRSIFAGMFSHFLDEEGMWDPPGSRRYFLGRAWGDKHTVWDFMCGPYMTFPHSQPVMWTHLPRELFFALRFGKDIQHFARQCVDRYLDRCWRIRESLGDVFDLGVGSVMDIETLSKKGPERWAHYLDAMQDQAMSYLAGAACYPLMVKPHALHPGNISISGQFSGLNSMQTVEPGDEPLVRAGLVCALLDGYIGIAILSAVLVGKSFRFQPFFDRFQTRIENQIHSAYLHNYRADNLEGLMSRGCAPFPDYLNLDGGAFPFSQRRPGDVSDLVSCLEWFADHLAQIYSGSIDSFSHLHSILSQPVVSSVSGLDLRVANLIQHMGGYSIHDDYVRSEINCEERATKTLCDLWFGDGLPVSIPKIGIGIPADNPFLIKWKGLSE